MQRILAGLACLAVLAGAASAADFGGVPTAPGAYGYTVLPPCSEPAVIGHIVAKFAYQDAHIIHSGVGIAAVDGARETRLKSGGPSLTDVRYCTARASLTNGFTSEVVYVIEGPMKGPHSIGYAVESCLPGWDPFRVYDGNCRAIRR